jgi:hypothetical protein
MKHLLLALFILSAVNAYSQTDHGTNVSGSSSAIAEPLGWLSGTSNDLDIISLMAK